MHPNFAHAIADLEPAFQALLAMEPAKPLALPTDVPASGVYLLSEGPNHLYVGRSKKAANARDTLRFRVALTPV